MVYYLLGIVTGILLTGFLVIISMLFKQPIIRTINQFESKLKTKGQIIEPPEEEIESWINNLPQIKHE